MAYSPVKEVALKHNIPVYQPIKLKDDRECIEDLKELNPDFIIVVAFGQILTKGSFRYTKVWMYKSYMLHYYLCIEVQHL